MTILAGLVVLRPEKSLPDDVCTTVRQAISRTPGDAVQEYRDRRSLLLKVDVGAFGEPAWHRGDEGSLSLLAGEALLAVGDPAARRSRAHDLSLLHQSWVKNQWSLLGKTRGAFCAAHYTPAAGRLSLIADKLGIRPLYYWAGDHYLVFATALRILEAVPLVPKVMDLRAITEALTLGTALGNRTPYLNVRLVGPGEIIHASPDGVTGQRYWRWDEFGPSDRPEREQVTAVWERFSAAVDCRLGGETGTVAFLSGGLDSRCVVAALRSRSVRVRAITVGEPGTQERAFAEAFAGLVGAEHELYPRVPDNADRPIALFLASWQDSGKHTAAVSERPQIVWGGEGGSVLLGGVYQTRGMVESLRRGDVEAAIAAFVRQEGARPARRLLTASAREALADVPFPGLREELAAIRPPDPGARLHHFLLVNDQRRQLSGHFEHIDLHRRELLTPFFDSDLVQTVCEIPVDRCLYHAFYVAWLNCFPPVVTSVPWQVYPGHIPCPLPVDGRLMDQWEELRGKEYRAFQRRQVLGQAAEALATHTFPHDLLRRSVLRLATWLHRTGWRDCGYLIEHANRYCRYWSRCGGQWRATEEQA